jgi:hypothetical protein
VDTPLWLSLWNLPLVGLGVLEMEGSRGLKLEEKAWMELDRVVLNATYLEEKLRLWYRQVWLLEGGAQRRDLEILEIKALFMHQSLLHEVNLTTVLLPIPTLKNLQHDQDTIKTVDVIFTSACHNDACHMQQFCYIW